MADESLIKEGDTLFSTGNGSSNAASLDLPAAHFLLSAANKFMSGASVPDSTESNHYMDGTITPRRTSKIMPERCDVGKTSGGKRKQNRAPKSEYKFGCPQCEIRFAIKSKLARHLKVHSGEKPHTCHLCPAKFARTDHLSTHLRSHSSERCFECPAPDCSSRFKSKTTLSRHMSRHEEKLFSCPQCSMEFTQNDDFKAHLTTHCLDRRFECAQCGARFKTKPVLATHIGRHTNEKPFACSECPLAFRLAYHLKAHLATHSNERLYTCAECSAKFKTKWQLASHTIKHSNERPFGCPHCPKMFKRREEVKQHLIVHTNAKEHTTAPCPIERTDSKRHSETCLTKETFSCPHCGANFETRVQLASHITTHSSEEKPYSCQKCSATLAQFSDSRGHPVATYGEEKCLPCDQCSAKSTLKNSDLVYLQRLSWALSVYS